MHRTISVIIPTLGREAELLEAVKSLLRQTVLPDEIVVVDQNQPSLPRVDEFFKSEPRIKHIKRSIPGYAKNLNVGLEAAQSEIVLFLDDDVELSPGLVEAHLANYEETKGLAGVAGRVLQPVGDQDPESLSSVGRYSFWSGSVFANFNSTRRSKVNIAAGGNMSFLRKVLLDVGGFDEGFDGNGYRCETDACLRVVEAGHELVFDPKAELTHLMAPRGGCRMLDKADHTFYYVKNGIRLYRRHSPWLGQGFFATRMAAYVFAKSVFNLRPKILTRGLEGVVQGFLKPIELKNSESSNATGN